MQDHDELFKELITEFFFEFMDLFFPNIASQLDRTFIEQLDKEVSSVSGSGRKQRADLVRKVWNKQSKGFILIHIEIQSTSQSKFQERMYRYYYAIEEKYRLPVLPIAVLTFKNPKQEQGSSYHGSCAGKRIIHFEFCLIQLNQYNWRSFIATDNPIASALMACMSYDNQERPEVKLECLRHLVRCETEWNRKSITQRFVDAYLKLNRAENECFQKRLSELNPREETKIMAYITSWEQQGIEIGLRRLVVSQLTRKFGSLPTSLIRKIEALSEEQLSNLGGDLLDFCEMQQLLDWLKTK